MLTPESILAILKDVSIHTVHRCSGVQLRVLNRYCGNSMRVVENYFKTSEYLTAIGLSTRNNRAVRSQTYRPCGNSGRVVVDRTVADAHVVDVVRERAWTTDVRGMRL